MLGAWSGAGLGWWWRFCGAFLGTWIPVWSSIGLTHKSHEDLLLTSREDRFRVHIITLT